MNQGSGKNKPKGRQVHRRLGTDKTLNPEKMSFNLKYIQ
jgi:hypothetical protein